MLRIAALAVAVLRPRAMRRMPFAALRMALLTIVALVAPLSVGAAMRLRCRPLGPLDWSRLQALERFGCGGEALRKRSQGDPLPRRALDVAQIAALVGAAEGDGD